MEIFFEKAKFYSRREYARRTNPRLGKKYKKMPHIYGTSPHQKNNPNLNMASSNEAVIYMRNNRHTTASKTNTQTPAQPTASAAQLAPAAHTHTSAGSQCLQEPNRTAKPSQQLCYISPKPHPNSRPSVQPILPPALPIETPNWIPTPLVEKTHRELGPTQNPPPR